jgi:hypothetical protein
MWPDVLGETVNRQSKVGKISCRLLASLQVNLGIKESRGPECQGEGEDAPWIQPPNQRRARVLADGGNGLDPVRIQKCLSWRWRSQRDGCHRRLAMTLNRNVEA